MEPSEFPTVVEQTGGLDPVLLILGAAIAAIMLLIGWFTGRSTLIGEAESRRRDACRSIHQAILDRARVAAAATRPHVMSSAQALADEIAMRLGPVAKLGAFGKHVKSLDEALKGPSKPPAPAAPAHAGGHGDGGHPPHPAPEPHHGVHPPHHPHAPAQVYNDVKVAHHDPHHHKPHEPEKPRDDHKPVDQIDAIRAAVFNFTDHWSRAEMLGELEAAQRALLTPAPRHVPIGRNPH